MWIPTSVFSLLFYCMPYSSISVLFLHFQPSRFLILSCFLFSTEHWNTDCLLLLRFLFLLWWWRASTVLLSLWWLNMKCFFCDKWQWLFCRFNGGKHLLGTAACTCFDERVLEAVKEMPLCNELRKKITFTSLFKLSSAFLLNDRQKLMSKQVDSFSGHGAGFCSVLHQKVLITSL